MIAHHCSTCNITFAHSQSLSNHIKSKKHTLNSLELYFQKQHCIVTSKSYKLLNNISQKEINYIYTQIPTVFLHKILCKIYIDSNGYFTYFYES